jgi:hypothetical protein
LQKITLLIWFNSYLSNRTQRVVIKDALLNIGQLKAVVPQGSVFGPLLLLVFINDIADGMTGLGRLLKTIFSKILLTQESKETG